jgi:hypothetical protein
MTFWGPTDGNDFVIGKFDFYLIDPADDFDDVHLGFIIDWDVPSDYGVDNSSGIFRTHPLTYYQRGVQTRTDDEDPPHDCPIPEDQRFAGLSILSGSAEAMWTAENVPMFWVRPASRIALHPHDHARI